ncbi:MAG: APC family permease [Gaiellaceae bacterium]
MAVDSPAGMPGPAVEVGEKGLKKNALGVVSNVVIGVASTAPAYSIAATLGFIVAVQGVGFNGPGVMIAAFVPMLLVAFAYRYLNRADPDCGTSFAWGTRALGPQMGWINGWAIFVTDVIVMASLSIIAAQYTYLLFGKDHASHSEGWLIGGAVVWIALMTWICWRGIELSARTQQVLLSLELLVLVAFSIVAIVKVYGGTPLPGAHHVAVGWFNPTGWGIGWGPLVDGVLLGLFIYWGWDTGVAVNEESRDASEGPGKSAIISTLLLLAIYVLVAVAAESFAGTKFLANNSNDVLSVMGKHVFGTPWDKLLIIAVLSSAAASTQTTILPTARTTLSMARWGSIPGIFGRIHSRYLTPTYSTLGMGALSIAWTVGILVADPAQNVLGDSISALGFGIAFYYGFTGLFCVVYYRRELFKSVGNFLKVGLMPFLGFGLMLGIFIKAFHDYSQAGFNYSSPVLGIQLPIVIGIGALMLGVPMMVLAWANYPRFFHRKPYFEVAPEGALEGRATVETIAPEADPLTGGAA